MLVGVGGAAAGERSNEALVKMRNGEVRAGRSTRAGDTRRRKQDAPGDHSAQQQRCPLVRRSPRCAVGGESLRSLVRRATNTIGNIRRAEPFREQGLLGAGFAHGARAEIHEQRLRGPFEDAQQPCVAKQLRERVALDIPPAAEQLERVIHGTPQEFRRSGLADDERIVSQRNAGVKRLRYRDQVCIECGTGSGHCPEARTSGGMIEQPAGCHLPSRCIPVRQLKRALDAPEAHCRHTEAGMQEGVVGHLHAAPHLAEHCIGRHMHAVEMHGILQHAPHAQG